MVSSIENARSLADFFHCTNNLHAFVYAKNKSYPDGKASMIEVAPQRSVISNVENARTSSRLVSTTRFANKLENLNCDRLFVLVSYDTIVGAIVVNKGQTDLILDTMQSVSNAMREHVSQWRAATPSSAIKSAA